MDRRRKKGSRRALKISFFATFGLLVLIVGGGLAYLQLNYVPVKHLPNSIPSYDAQWAKYISKDVLQFSYQNFTYLRQINSSLPFFNTILKLTNPVVAINTTEVRSLVAMEFQTPNASVDIAFMAPGYFAAFESHFDNLTGFAHHVGNSLLYQVQDVATKKPAFGWLAIIPGDDAVGFAPGFAEAEQGMSIAVRVPTQANSSILALPDIRQMLYLSGGASGHISVGLNSFNGVIAASLKTMTTVDFTGSRINLTRTVEYLNDSLAYGEYSTVKTQYPKAITIIVFDSYVRASQLDAISQLGGDYRLVQ